MNFHIPTLMLVIITSSLVLAGALALVGFRRQKVLMIWSLALTLHGLVYGLFLLRGRIGDLWSVVLANAGLAAVFSLFAFGLACFYRQRLPALALWGPAGAVAAYFSLNLDDMTARVVFGGLVYCLQVFLTLWVLARHHGETRGRGQYIVMAGFVLVLLMFMVRAMATAGGYVEISHLFANNQLQQVSFLSAILALLMLSSGLVLMVQERSEAKLLVSRELLARQNAELFRYSEDLEKANAKLEALSNTDPLTGLYNRRFFDEQLSLEGARACRHGHSFAVIMIDIDHFKRFNDRYGHPAGDACLIKVAAVLQASLQRAGDVLARIGGEEFVVIVTETDAPGLELLAARICDNIRALQITHEDAPAGVVTLSLGIALAVSMEDVSPQAVLKRADEALYQAKDGGRDRFVMAALEPFVA